MVTRKECWCTVNGFLRLCFETHPSHLYAPVFSCRWQSRSCEHSDTCQWQDAVVAARLDARCDVLRAVPPPDRTPRAGRRSSAGSVVYPCAVFSVFGSEPGITTEADETM
eukprot:gene14607-biopygen8114